MTKLIVPALLCAIAVGQMTLARVSTLTAWKGGGFGMFASVDRPNNRYLSIVGYDAAGYPHTIDVPWRRFTYSQPLTKRFARRTMAFPSETRLSQIAEAVLNADLRRSTDPDTPPSSLMDSPYELSLVAGLRSGHQVDVVGPMRSDLSISGLQRIEARVLVLDVDVEQGRVFFRPLGSPGATRNNPISAHR